MYIESIKKRTSIRTFTQEKLSEEMKKKIDEIIKTTTDTPFKTNCIFKLIELSDEKLLNGLITYGVIKNPKYFIVGMVEKNCGNLIDFGFSFEKIVLELTLLGIGSCWLGGTFNQSQFSELADSRDEYIIPCVVAIGYPMPKKSLTDSVIRLMASSSKRKAWGELFFQNNFKEIAKPENQHLKTALDMVRLAPSASNKQPWRLLVDNKYIHFFISRNKTYNKVMDFLNLSDLQLVDMGIAMNHLASAIQEFGVEGRFEKISNEFSHDNLTYIISYQMTKR